MEFDRGVLDQMFMVIKLVKIAQIKHGTEYAKRLLPAHYEDIFEIFITLMEDMKEKTDSKYYDDGGSGVNLFRYVTDDMTEYFQLAYEYGELRGLDKDKNAYIADTIKCLNSTVGWIESYCYGYRLYHSKTGKPRLYFLFDGEYWMPIETIEALYEFFDFFPQMLPVLQSEVNELRRQSSIKILPKKKRKARKIA